MNDNKNFDKIEDYLLDHMTPTEKEAFEAAITTDSRLAKEVKLQKAEHKAMQLMLRDKLRGKLGKWQSEVKAETQATVPKVVKLDAARRNRYFRLSIAASVLLLIGLFTNNWVDNNLSDTALADEFFNATYSARKGGENTNASTALSPGLTAMQDQNYTKAVELFSQVADGNYRETALVLKGESYFQLGEYQNAIEAFMEVMQNKVTPLNVEKAEWKVLLAQLKLGNRSAVHQLKSKILENPEHSYYPRVVELENKQGNFLKTLFD